jgi:L-threonine-O-3-phosphate decarboxylase
MVVSNSRPQHGGNLAWASAQANCPHTQIVDFSASINPLGPPKSAITAIYDHLQDLQAYPDPDATLLRRQLSDLHHLPMDWILPGNGAAELLTWACRELAMLHHVDLPSPAFNDYQRALKAFGAKIVRYPIPIEEDGLQTLPKILQNAAFKRHSGLLLNNPHNPTGQILTQAVLIPLLRNHDLVVVDEAFMDFLYPQDPYSLVGMVRHYPNLVVLRSLTKFYSLPGLRLGYAIGHPSRLQRWQQWRDPWAVNTLAIAAGVAALADHDFQTETLKWFSKTQPQLFDQLQSLPRCHPLSSVVNFFLVRYEGSVRSLQERLLKQDKLLIRDCASFPELGDQYFRVAVRTEAENNQLIAALKALV